MFQEAFDKRVAELYHHQQAMVRQRKFKSGKRAGMVRVPAQRLPFTSNELWGYLDTFCGLRAVQCPYCGAPIDILSLTLDHVVPRALGGSIGLENIRACCTRCNSLKEKLMLEEFLQLLEFLGKCSTHMRSNIESRLLGQLRRFDFAKKAKGPNWVPPPKEQQIPLEEKF